MSMHLPETKELRRKINEDFNVRRQSVYALLISAVKENLLWKKAQIAV